MREVMWKEKKYIIPFDVNLEWDKDQEVEIRNRFSGELCKTALVRCCCLRFNYGL
jgi:hypothetical protein